jgi:hypothetical protein
LISDEIVVQIVDTLKEKTMQGADTGNIAQGKIPGGHQGDQRFLLGGSG